MNLFKKLRHLKDVNTNAAQASREVLEQANRHGEDADVKQEQALVKLEQATAQAKRLSAADQRNHYSESLTYSMRGKHA